MHRIDRLPDDIQCRIFHDLDQVSKRQLSNTSRTLRKVTAPYFNPSIRITESFNDKEALLLTLQQHGRELIDEVNFCVRPKALDDQGTQVGPGKPGVSTAAQEILSGTHTPNLRRINLEYDFELEKEEPTKFEQGVAAFDQPKEEDTLLQLENDQTWRRLLADTWNALAANRTVTRLSVKRFVPVWSSAFHSAEFRKSMGRLERLDISIFGMKNGRRSINTVPTYNDSLQSLLKVFFLHASSLKRLTLQASQQAPLSARGNYHIPLSLKATQLPKLEHLALKNCFIGFELAHFINGHSSTLKTIDLHNCYAYRSTSTVDESSSGGMYWAPFLALINKPGMRLRRLTLSDDHIPLTIDDKRLAKYNPEKANEPEDVKNVRRAQKASPKKRLLLYAYLRDYSGELWMNKDAIVASFEAGDDQWAYDELVSAMKRNSEGSQEVAEEEDEENGAADSGCEVDDSTEIYELPG
ncbi:hypothetical protein VP1G_06960 [Cytospora mali]|uniref:F-box domain-containing protein n=1 Tax=Cytospora mali TaxID=578113 RepID=A0A194V6X2_CYTMA|nr:hypothetical protein VP1G_06960 [Valsa mali var. pyri (nom. inval.)]